MSQATWRKIEKAVDPPYRRSTLIAIAQALRWTEDSIDRLLDGGEPTLVPDGTQPDVIGRLDRLETRMDDLAQRFDQLADER